MRSIIVLVQLTLLVLALMRKRWAYVAFVVVALLGIPSRTGFRLVRPSCESALTAEQLVQSLGNTSHVILFAMFAIVTAIQFRGSLTSRLAWTALIATIFGVIIELQQGATRTGNCELHDLVPNTIGILIALAVTVLWIVGARHRRRVRDPGAGG